MYLLEDLLSQDVVLHVICMVLHSEGENLQHTRYQGAVLRPGDVFEALVSVGC